jgi:hypothetical protein
MSSSFSNRSTNAQQMVSQNAALTLHNINFCFAIVVQFVGQWNVDILQAPVLMIAVIL